MTQISRIWMVDDHVLIRHSLKDLIEKIGPYKITREFDTGIDFINALPGSELPHLLILDLSMPVMNGEDVMQKLHQLSSNLPVLILTLDEDEGKVIRLFRLGARGYLRKNCSASELENAIREILDRGYYHNEFLALSLKKTNETKEEKSADKILKQLTPREKNFLGLVCHEKEYTYEQIADQMNVTSRTVDGYRESIFEKFGIRSKTGLVLFVLKHRLFEALTQSDSHITQ